MKKQFLGDFLIEKVKVEGENVILTVKDKKETIRMPKKMMEKLVSSEPVGATDLQDKKLLTVAQDIVQVLLMWDVKMNEVEKTFQVVSDFLNEKLDYASAHLWMDNVGSKPEEGYIPNEVFGARTVNDVNNLFTKLNGKENNSKTQ